MKVQPNKILITICFCIFARLTHAQICSGSLGDPVINIDFGSGPNPGPALKNNLPNLNYFPNACPDDGMYTIANSSGNCFGNTWHTYSFDHTPNDVNGYMMIVNASYNSGDFYVDTIKGLCTGTTYEFAAWITNLFRNNPGCATTIKPSLQFNIESVTGVVLATYTTGEIVESTSAVWKQYGLFFTTPANAQSVVLRIANNAPGGCGNDLAIDDITFRPCGPNVNITAIGATGPAIHQCIDNIRPVQFIANIGSGYSSPNTFWQKSLDCGKSWIDISTIGTATNFTYMPTAIGTMLIRVQVADGGNISVKSCRVASNEFTVQVHDLPGKNAFITNPACEKTIVNLNAGTGDYFNWTGPNGFSSTVQSTSLIAEMLNEGTYTLNVSDIFGCKSTKSLSLMVLIAPTTGLADSVHVCENKSTQIIASGGTSYLWQPATGLSASDIADPIVTISKTTSYEVIVGNSENCFDTATIKIIVDESPKADAGPDQFIFEGQSTTLMGKASGTNISWQWTPIIGMNNSQSITPTINPTDDIVYKLIVESALDCPVATDEVFVRVYKKILVPNAFSPNGDGINDTWNIEALVTYPESTINVYDRFGRTVFHSKGYNHPWDGNFNGKPLPVGVYYYVVDTRNGNQPIKGSVMIIR